MKRLLAALLLALVMIVACSKSVDKMTPDSPTYQLAAELANKIPMLDPEKNATLAKAKNFTLSTGSLFKELETNMGRNITQLTDADTSELATFLGRVLDSMVETQVLLQAASEKGISIQEAQVDSVVQIFFRNNGGEERFITILTNNGLTLEMLKTDIEKNLKREIYLNTYLFNNIEINEQDLKDAYAEDKTASVRHILLSTQGKSVAEKEKIHSQMENLLARARAGEDFAELAKQYTDDPGSKENGGLYENFPRGQMVKAFEDAAFSVPVGEISDIIETTYGYHILKVIERKKENQPLDDVKTALESQLQNRKRQTLYSEMVDSLKTAQKVKVLFN
ncbi:peptidylprolyl isomerase [candidate division KSB1 bacterium]|nr:peptidylprolyl isomerase [candidate division KSB1 bacterium]